MYNLLNNDCIKLIDIDDESGGCQGEIYFHGGEIYSGSIVNNLPCGEGQLQLKDKSIFKGNFNNKSITSGQFKHFTGLVFEGQFKRDKFYKGEILFQDGDILQGQWGIKRNKWILKQGSLFDEEDNLLYEFDYQNKTEFKSKLKTIYTSDKNYGFLIEYDYYYNQTKQAWKPLKITADSQTQYCIENLNSIKEITSNYQFIPYSKEIVKKNQNIKSQKYQISLGFQIELKKLFNEDLWKLKFKCLKNIEAIGDFNLQKNLLHFNGRIYLPNNLQKNFQINKRLLSNLEIIFDDLTFDSLENFCQSISKNYPKVIYIEQKKIRKKSVINKQAFKEIVNDLKQEEQCVIF